jgi:hypothetical protein
MNDLQKVDNNDLVSMFFIISDEYHKHSQYDSIPEISASALSRLERKLSEIRLEIEQRGIELKRAE